VVAAIHNFLGFNKQESDLERRRKEALEDGVILSELKDHLIRFERMVRIFEMTYIDLTIKLSLDL
jgi:hypothetical protein